MKTKQVSLPIEVIIDLLKSLDDQAKEQIFNEVFVGYDRASLSPGEEQALKTAMKEYERGETVSWMNSG